MQNVVAAIKDGPDHYPSILVHLSRSPGTFVRKGGSGELIDPAEMDNVTAAEVDLLASRFAVAYRLLTSFPERFPDHVKVMGEDSTLAVVALPVVEKWQAALSVYSFFSFRRQRHQPWEHKRTKPAVWYGHIE